jgi:hypothetical protein
LDVAEAAMSKAAMRKAAKLTREHPKKPAALEASRSQKTHSFPELSICHGKGC